MNSRLASIFGTAVAMAMTGAGARRMPFGYVPHADNRGSKGSVFKGVDLGAINHDVHWRHRHNPAGTKAKRKAAEHKIGLRE